MVEKKKVINRYTGEVMEEKPSASPSPTEMKREVGVRSPSPLVSTSPPPPKEDELPALDTFTEEDQANILKIQSAARGKMARKEVAAKKKAKAVQDALPPLDSFSEEDQANILKIQSVARGKKARKEVEARKAAEAAALADGVVLSEYTTQDEKAVVKIQANARGFLARKKVREIHAPQ